MGRRDARLALGEERQRLVHGHRQHLGDVAPAQRVLQHGRLKTATFALLADGGDAGHHAQIGIDHPGAVAHRAGPFGVGAEQRRLHAVGFGERFADGFEQPGVGGGVGSAGSLDGSLIHRDHPGAGRDRAVDQRALPGASHTGDHHQHAKGDVHVDVLEVVQVGAADLQRPAGGAHLGLEPGAVVEVLTGERVRGAQPCDVAFEADLAAVAPGAGAEVHHVVGDGNHLRFVFHHEHRVAFIAQAQQEGVHPLDVVGVQAGGGFVEHVGDVGEGGAQVSDHLGALGLAAGQRPRGAIQRQVPQADLHERVQRHPQRLQQGSHTRGIQRAHPLGKIADLHRARIGDADAIHLRAACGLVEPGPAAIRAGGERDRTIDERPDVRLHRLAVLAQHRLGDLRNETLVGHVHVVDGDLHRFAVEEVVEFFLRVLLDRFVCVEESGLGEDAHHPAVGGVAGDGDRPFGQRFRSVVQLGEVDVVHPPQAFAPWAHAAGHGVFLDGGLAFAAALGNRDRTLGRHRGHVERERVGGADVGLAQTAEDDAQHGVGVGGGAHGGAGVRAHAFLVDDDGGGQALEDVHVGPGQVGHEPLHERAVGLVDHPLRFRGDRGEHQRALPGARHPREHAQAPLGDLHADVLEVVLAGTAHSDQVVVVGGVWGHGHESPFGGGE